MIINDYFLELPEKFHYILKELLFTLDSEQYIES